MQVKFSFQNFYLFLIRRCGHSICKNCSFSGKLSSKDNITVCKQCHLSMLPKKSLREIIIIKKYNVIHYYKIVERGRQFYRTLIFSSDWRYCFYDMSPIYPLDQPCDFINRFVSAEGSPPDLLEYQQPTLPDYSLIIIRNFGNNLNDKQIFIPSRILKGIIPEPLLNDYMFWQVL